MFMNSTAGIITLIVFTLVFFFLFTFIRRWFDSFITATFAISSIINGILFAYGTAPIEMSNFIFGLDSVLLTMFAYCIAVKFVHFSRKETILLCLSCLLALFLSAIIKYFVMCASSGYTWENAKSLIKSLFATISCATGITLEILIFHSFKKHKWNKFLGMGLGIVVCSLITSAVYYLLNLAANEISLNQDSLKIFLGSCIIKLSCCVIALICYYINTHWWLSKEVIEREKACAAIKANPEQKNEMIQKEEKDTSTEDKQKKK